VLSAPRRWDLVARIDAYRRGDVPLSVPVALLGTRRMQVLGER
jgi:uncharacterized protein YbgA (DUF1722 family)